MVPLREEDLPGVFAGSSHDSKLLYNAKLLALATANPPLPRAILVRAARSLPAQIIIFRHPQEYGASVVREISERC